MTDAAPDRPTGLVTVDVVLPRAAGRRQLAALRLWLTDGDHVRIPLRAIPVTAPQPDTGDARGSGYDGTGGRIDPADRRSVPTSAVSAALRPAEDHRLRGRFVGAAPCGTYVLCGDGSEVALRFPPRPVEVGAGGGHWCFEVVPDGTPYFRVGRSLVGYDPARQRNLAAVVRDVDLDAEAADRLIGVLASHHYHRVIDLTRRPTGPTTDTGRDPLVLEFSPSHPFAPKAGRLVRASAEIARRADLAPCMVRLGRMVSCDGGRVVLDNEVVLGFWPGTGAEQAVAQIERAGGRVVEDLSDDDELIVVARFDDAEPERALAITERWLDEGLLHWTEPNLVES